MFQDVKYEYTANLAGTGDWSEYDIESYWKVVVVFQERYRHRGSSEPASFNITDWLDLTYKPFVGISPNLKLRCSWDESLNWLDFEVRRSKLKVTARHGQISTVAFSHLSGMHGKYSDETRRNYSLPARSAWHWWMMTFGGHGFKVADIIFQTRTFPAETQPHDRRFVVKDHLLYNDRERHSQNTELSRMAAKEPWKRF